MPRHNGLAGWFRVAALALAIATLSTGPASGQSNVPTVAVTDLDVTDFDEGTVELSWEISGEPSYLADIRARYCIRARRGTEDWTEKCADDPNTTQASVDIGKPSHCRPEGVDYNTKGEAKIQYKGQIQAIAGNPSFLVDVDAWTD